MTLINVVTLINRKIKSKGGRQMLVKKAPLKTKEHEKNANKGVEERKKRKEEEKKIEEFRKKRDEEAKKRKEEQKKMREEFKKKRDEVKKRKPSPMKKTLKIEAPKKVEQKKKEEPKKEVAKKKEGKKEVAKKKAEPKKEVAKKKAGKKEEGSLEVDLDRIVILQYAPNKEAASLQKRTMVVNHKACRGWGFSFRAFESSEKKGTAALLLEEKRDIALVISSDLVFTSKKNLARRLALDFDISGKAAVLLLDGKDLTDFSAGIMLLNLRHSATKAMLESWKKMHEETEGENEISALRDAVEAHKGALAKQAVLVPHGDASKIASEHFKLLLNARLNMITKAKLAKAIGEAEILANK